MGLEETFNHIGHGAKNFVIGIAILILTMFVVVYGINTFYEKPSYEDFCGEFKTQEIINTEEICSEIGGKWTAYEGVKPIEEKELTVEGYCDRDYTCRQEYEDALEKHARYVFFVSIPLAILIIALGAFVFSLNSVGIGLMFGGVGTLIYGAGGYWRYSENLLKFIISLIGLIVLIFLAYWFNRRISGK